MNPNLFKSAEFYQRRYHNFATVLIIPLTLLVLFLFLFSFIGTKEVTVTSIGKITPTEVIAVVQSTSDNTILTNNLVENKRIQKDDLLIQYSETMETSQKNAIESQLATYHRQKDGLEILKSSLQQNTNLFTSDDEFGYTNTFNRFISQSQDIEFSISKNNNEVNNQSTIAENTISEIVNQITALNNQISAYNDLYNAIATDSSLPADNPHQATFNSYKEQYQKNPDQSITNQYLSQITASITNLEASIASLEIQKAGIGNVATYDTSLPAKIETLRTEFIQATDQELTTVQTQIIELENQLTQANTLLQNTTITASANGILQVNKNVEGQTLLAKGTEIAQIYPDITESQDVLITYYVGSDYISSLKKGQITRLTLEKIGNHSMTVIGTINHIDASSTETDQGNLFKVTAKANVSKSDSRLLKYGLQGRVTSIIAKKTFFSYYMDKILNNLE